MNRGPAVLHRITVGFFGVVFVAIGVAALGWQGRIGPIRSWVDHLNPRWATNATTASWWWAVLLGAVIIAAVWGFLLLGAASRPGKVDDLVLAGSGTDGELTVPPKLIASAVADQLATDTTFSRVSAKAVDDRGRAIIRIEVTAPPRYSYDEIAAKLAPAMSDLRAAVAGSDIHVQTLVHLENTK